jgi:hypothetical protein
MPPVAPKIPHGTPRCWVLPAPHEPPSGGSKAWGKGLEISVAHLLGGESADLVPVV